MNRLAPALLATLAVLALPALAQTKPAAEKKIYCWDEGGRKVCGDALPATAVDNARTEFSSSGMATRHLDRAPTDAERAELDAQAEQARVAAADADARERRELAMVESYASEEDLRKAYAHRIGLLETAVKTSLLSIDGLRSSLVTLLQRAGETELAGKPVAKPLVANIQRQQALLLEQRHALVGGDGGRALPRTQEARSRRPGLTPGRPGTGRPAHIRTAGRGRGGARAAARGTSP